MRTIKIIILAFACVFCLQPINAQTLNWNSLKNSKHIINLGIGWDYGLSYNLGYAYQIDTSMPLVLNASFSIPSGKTLSDDFKTKIGGQILVLKKENLKGGIALNAIFRRFENPLVRLVNFGSELRGTFGYYKSQWFVAGEIGFDKAIITHFKHSESFRDHIYQDVKNGWYEPATGGNFYYGLQTGYSLKKYDVTFNIGKVVTQDFKTTPLIPYYLMLGVNYKIL